MNTLPWWHTHTVAGSCASCTPRIALCDAQPKAKRHACLTPRPPRLAPQISLLSETETGTRTACTAGRMAESASPSRATSDQGNPFKARVKALLREDSFELWRPPYNDEASTGTRLSLRCPRSHIYSAACNKGPASFESHLSPRCCAVPLSTSRLLLFLSFSVLIRPHVVREKERDKGEGREGRVTGQRGGERWVGSRFYKGEGRDRQGHGSRHSWRVSVLETGKPHAA